MDKTVIIGGGVAGLSAGIYTRLLGGEATVIEANNTCGGALCGWRRGEWRIDNCIHWLTGTNPETPTYKMWCDLGALGGIPIHQGDTLYSFEKNGKRVSLFRSLEKTEQDMLAASPEDARETGAFISAVRILRGIQGTAGENKDGKFSFSEKIKGAPRLIRYHTMSIGALAKRFKSPVLKGFFRCFLGDDFTAITLVIIFATFTADNGGIPEGASVGMAKRITDRFLNLGGEVLLGRAAARINLQGKRAVSVSLADGSEVLCDSVIIAKDPAEVFGKMLTVKMPSDLKKLYSDRRAYRFSSIHTAFGFEGAPSFSGDLIIEVPRAYRPVINSEYLVLREFSHDKHSAPEGKTLISAMVFCKEDKARAFIAERNSYPAYALTKERISECMKEILIAKFPEMQDKLRIIDCWTPATYKRYLGTECGSYMSFIFPPWKIPPKISNKVEGFENIYMATQWATLPGGLPLAAEEGRKCAKIIAAAREKAGQPQPKKARIPFGRAKGADSSL